MLDEVLRRWGYAEVTPMDAYVDIFRLGSGLIQRMGDPSGNFKTNPLIYFKNDDEKSGHYRVMFEDDFERCLSEASEYDFAIMSGLTYFGRRNTLENASKCYALIMDLDGVTDDKLNLLLSWVCPVMGKCPYPSYIAMSGHGVHLYWVFDKPIDLYPNIKEQLKRYKYQLITQVWNSDTSDIDTPQYQGINQGFRPFGCKTKIKGKRVRVFRYQDGVKYSVDDMNACIFDDKKQEACIDISKRLPQSNTNIQTAQERWPEWYEKRIVNKEDKSRWAVSSNLYRWYLNQIANKARYGHRYFCILHLASIGKRCSIYDAEKNPHPVTYEQVRRDAYSLKESFSKLNDNEPFNDSDIESALECFDWDLANTRIETVSAHVGFDITRSKRNGRTRQAHMKRVNRIIDLDIEDGEPDVRYHGGAPTKEQLVKSYAVNHPEMSNRQIAIALGISRNTVNKWLKG